LAGYDVVRVSGDGVAGTAAALADYLLGTAAADRVLVARGDTFADALSLAGPAAAFGYPLLFVEPDHVPEATCDWLGIHGARTIHVAGGPRAISDGVLEELEACGTQTESVALLWRRTLTPDVVRDAGASRVETAVAIAEQHFGHSPDHVSVANGWKWPDAVTGGALAAAYGAPILVLPPEAIALPSSVAGYLDAVAPQEAFVLGGPVVVSDLVEADLEGGV
jgi:putative cell wall-binding protein